MGTWQEMLLPASWGSWKDHITGYCSLRSSSWAILQTQGPSGRLSYMPLRRPWQALHYGPATPVMVKEPSNPPKGLTVDTSIHTSRSRFADFSPGHENQGPILSQLIQDAGPQICIELMQLIFKKEKKKFKKWKEALNRFFFFKEDTGTCMWPTGIWRDAQHHSSSG